MGTSNVDLYAVWQEVPNITDSLGNEYVYVPGIMWQPNLHVGKDEVTTELFNYVMGFFYYDISSSSSVSIDNVSWYDAILFCNLLSEMEGLTSVYWISSCGGYLYWPTPSYYGLLNDHDWDAAGHIEGTGYRLPTASEWEYIEQIRSNSIIYNGIREWCWDEEYNVDWNITRAIRGTSYSGFDLPGTCENGLGFRLVRKVE